MTRMNTKSSGCSFHLINEQIPQLTLALKNSRYPCITGFPKKLTPTTKHKQKNPQTTQTPLFRKRSLT